MQKAALYDVPVFREFCGIDLGRERVPDATTLLKFRHLLEEHKLGAAMFAKVGELLLANGMKLSGGTIVDATLIAAPPSTKHQEKSRDPEMHQTKKGNEWHFLNPFLDGMKLHIGADSQTGLVHSASVTAANVHDLNPYLDSHQVPNLLHGNETRFYGDSAYRGKAQRERLWEMAPKARDFLNPFLDTNKRAYRNCPLMEADKETNRRKSSVRSKAPVPDLEAPVGLCQGALSRLGKECQPGLRRAGDAQHQQMGTTSHRRGASGMGRMRRNSLRSGSKQADYLMKMTLASQFRLDFSSLLNFAAAYSAFP